MQITQIDDESAVYHLLAIVLQSSELSRYVITGFVSLARRLTTWVDEICVHDEVVSRPKVVAILAATGAGVRCRGADRRLRFPRTPPKFFFAIALFLKK